MMAARSLSLLLFCAGISSLLLSCKGPDVPEAAAFAGFDAGISKDTNVSVDSVAKEDIKEPEEDVLAKICGPEGAVNCEHAPSGMECAPGHYCFAEECALWTMEELEKSKFDNGIVKIPGGEFEIGCVGPKDKQCSPGEKPRRTVKLNDFLMLTKEVSSAEYHECVKEEACTLPNSECLAATKNPNYPPSADNGNAANHPIHCVRWEQAQAYCQWWQSTGELPTEAQFEYVLRNNESSMIYPIGDSLSELTPGLVNLPDSGSGWGGEGEDLIEGFNDGYTESWPVDQGKPNAFGLLNIWGNVWEWTRDTIQPKTGYAALAETNPHQSNGESMVIRGAGFRYTGIEQKWLRSSWRWVQDKSDFADVAVGFRCVVETQPNPCAP